MGTHVQFIHKCCVSHVRFAQETDVSSVFAPPNQVYRVRSPSRQGKKESSDYIQELRALFAAMQLDMLLEAVQMTIFLNGLTLGLPGRRFP